MDKTNASFRHHLQQARFCRCRGSRRFKGPRLLFGHTTGVGFLWWEAPRGSVHFGVLPITHRIHVCYIWQHGSHQYTPNVSIYTSTMDPMNPMGFIQPSFHGGLPRISVVVIIPQLTTQSKHVQTMG